MNCLGGKRRHHIGQHDGRLAHILDDKRLLNLRPLEPAFDHFRRRYYAGGTTTHLFDGLKFRPRDRADLTVQMLSGQTSQADDLAGLLLILWRLRNNLFHGEKWEYALRDQRENFRCSNLVLMHVLDVCNLTPIR